MFHDILTVPRTKRKAAAAGPKLQAHIWIDHFGSQTSLVVLGVGMTASAGTMALSSIVSLESV